VDTNSATHGQLLNALREHAARASPPVDESLLAPHALMDRIAAEAAIRQPGPGGDAWQTFAGKKIHSSRELTGRDKTALAVAWFENLRRTPRFTEMAKALDASGAVADAGSALSNLFLAGVTDYTTITEQRLAGGGVGIQVSVLGRDYQLDPGGSLERLPGG
jgi:hypothetical protein